MDHSICWQNTCNVFTTRNGKADGEAARNPAQASVRQYGSVLALGRKPHVRWLK
jgi:hypothetical protein